MVIVTQMGAVYRMSKKTFTQVLTKISVAGSVPDLSAINGARFIGVIDSDITDMT